MSLVHEIDYGTPASRSAEQVTLTIDGQQVTVPAGTSIMRAAMDTGIQVPKLCATDSVEAFGSCRLCLVEIAGRAGTPASCTTPVAPGMVVSTQTERLKQIRKGVMELYISDHPLDCLTCAANGDCELQDMAGAVGLREVRYGYDGENHTTQEKDESQPVLHLRSVEVHRLLALRPRLRGSAGHLRAHHPGPRLRLQGLARRLGDDFLSSECVSCGACVQACPTATLSEKSLIEIGQPEHSVVTTCAYCGVGCSFKAEMRGEELVRMVPYKDGKANRGHSCVKGRFAWGYAQHKERILKPMIRETIDQPWREVSWEVAIDRVASEFKRLQAKHGRLAIGGITSSRCTNEETYLVQKLIRGGFGNNNVDTCARVCHSPTGFGLSQAFGTSAGTQDFDSVEQTDVIVVIGANPTDAHPVFASRMKKRLRQGAKLIVIDPRRTDLVRSAACRSRLSSAAPARHQCRDPECAGPHDRHRGPDQRGLRARVLRSRRVRVLGRVRLPAGEQPGGGGPDGRCRSRCDPRRGPALCHRRQRRDLLRPRRHRAQPGHDGGDGDRQPRDGHRQSRSQGRRREPAARPEQRPGRLRHGLLPARADRLSPHLRRRHAQHVRDRCGAASSTASPACASPTCSTPRSRAPSRASTCRARTSCSPIPTPPMSCARCPRWNASWCRTCS